MTLPGHWLPTAAFGTGFVSAAGSGLLYMACLAVTWPLLVLPCLGSGFVRVLAWFLDGFYINADLALAGSNNLALLLLACINGCQLQ